MSFFVNLFFPLVGKIVGKNPSSFEGASIKQNLIETTNIADTPSSALHNVDSSSGANSKLGDDILYKARNSCRIWQHLSDSTFVADGLAVGRQNRMLM